MISRNRRLFQKPLWRPITGDSLCSGRSTWGSRGLQAVPFRCSLITRFQRNRAKFEAASEAGFTLLEVIVVIVIMGLIMGLVAEYGPQKDHWLQTRGAAQAVAEAMLRSRGQAIASGQPVALKLPSLPGWLTETVSGPVVFEPDGSSTGGMVTLDDQGRRIDVSADWLTARISVHED
jgi:general secretion pathway protein H